MILKSFEINKINLEINHLILFYGKNEGLKNESLNILIKNKNNVSTYEEKEILDNDSNFIENIYPNHFLKKKNLLLLKEQLIKF